MQFKLDITPDLAAQMDDAQVAEVVRLIQNHWGNAAEIEASADLVDDFRH